MDPTVLRGDFLDVLVGSAVRVETSSQVGEDFAAHTTRVSPPPSPSAATGGDVCVESTPRLVELPAASFDAITMSLVLSYLPTPEHRRLMIAKARALLYVPSPDALGAPAATATAAEIIRARGTAAIGTGTIAEDSLSNEPDGQLTDAVIDTKEESFASLSNQKLDQQQKQPYPGILVIAEKASIFGVGSKDESVQLRRNWTDAICNEGFECLVYRDEVLAGHHVHVFAFKAVERYPSERSCIGGGQVPNMAIKSDSNKSNKFD